MTSMAVCALAAYQDDQDVQQSILKAIDYCQSAFTAQGVLTYAESSQSRAIAALLLAYKSVEKW